MYMPIEMRRTTGSYENKDQLKQRA